MDWLGLLGIVGAVLGALGLLAGAVGVSRASYATAAIATLEASNRAYKDELERSRDEHQRLQSDAAERHATVLATAQREHTAELASVRTDLASVRTDLAGVQSQLTRAEAENRVLRDTLQGRQDMTQLTELLSEQHAQVHAALQGVDSQLGALLATLTPAPTDRRPVGGTEYDRGRAAPSD